MTGKEVKDIDNFQSITDNTKILGYDESADKYGLISVGKINQT